MQLSELYLNRYLYKEGQTSETDNTEYVSANQTNYPSSFVAYGGNSAIDVNTNTTTINGGKIRTGVVESTGYTYVSGVYSSVGMQINLDNGAIRSPQFAIDSAGNAYFKGDISGASGTFTGNITVGSGNNVFKVFAGTGMWLGNASFASAPFRVDMAGNVTASSLTLTNAYISTGSTWAGNVIDNAYIGNLNAGKITTGTLTVGDGTSQALILINQSSGGGGAGTSAYLRWSGGSKIWSDTSNYMGINAIGGQLYVYAANEQIALFQSGGNRTIFYKDVGINNTYVYYNSGSSESIYGGNLGRIEYNASTYHYHNINGNLRLRLSDSGLVQYSSSGEPQFFTNFIQVTGPNPQIGTASARFYLYGSTVRYTTLINDSDETIKKNIVPLAYGLTELNALTPIKYEYKENDENIHLGFTAQDVEKVMPELVSEDEGIKCLSSIELIPVLIAAVQELSKEIELLKSKI